LIAPIDHTLADTQIGVAIGITTLPHVKDFSIVGPYNVTGISDTASRRKIFTCRPTSAADEPVCAGKIVRTLATQAFRGPVSDYDFNGLMKFYTDGRKEGRFRVRDLGRDRSHSRQPAVPVPAREHAGHAARRRIFRGPRRNSCAGVEVVSPRRSGAGVAAVVFHLGRRAGCRAREAGGVRTPERAGYVRSPIPTSIARSATRSSRNPSCSSTASSAKITACSIC
jgi:hypothetical protein